jgi:hypothetical protein
MSLTLSNGHARATVLSAVWSPPDQQLVAVLMAATDKTVLKALKAELEKNNRNSFVALAGDAQAELAGAKRGYVQLSASLEKVNAQGHVMALLHWRAHDPRAVLPASKAGENSTVENDFFYVVARRGHDLPALFAERLQLALAWALEPSWAEPLLELGREAGLVDCLPVGAASELRPLLMSASDAPRKDGLAFQSALRVTRDEDRWGAVISTALATGTIRL